MDRTELLRRRWYVALPMLLVTGVLALLVNEEAAQSFEASGVVMIVDPEVDPGRSVLRGIHIPAIIEQATTDAAREAVLDAGGTTAYTVMPVGPRRIQVHVSDDVETAAATAEAVLRHMERSVEEEQAESDRALDERVRSRLFIEVPPDDDGTSRSELAAERTEVTGTLVLQDPLETGMNPYGSRDSTSLLTATVSGEAERARIGTMLGEDVTFSLTTYEGRTSGMLELTVRGPDAAATLAGFDVMVDVLEAELEDRQVTAAVPLSQRRLLEVLAAPQQATDTTPRVHLSTMAIAIIGLVITAASVSILERRARPGVDGPLEADGSEGRTSASHPDDRARV